MRNVKEKINAVKQYCIHTIRTFAISLYIHRQTIVIAFKVITVVICLFIFSWFFRLIIPLVTGQSLGITEFGTINPISQVEDVSKISKPIIVFHIYEIEGSSNSIGIELTEVALPPNICIEGITLWGGYTGYAPPYTTNPLAFGGDRVVSGGGDIGGFSVYGCSTNKATWLNVYNLARDKNKYENLENKLFISVQPIYYYPFDERSLKIYPQVDLYSNNSERQQVKDYEIAGWVTSPNFDEKILIKKNSIGDVFLYDVELYFYRPISNRTLTIILLGTLFLFIISLIFIVENGTFLEVSVGIIFGLWGIQDILIPKNTVEPTIINSLIIALYICFVFAIMIRFVRFSLWKWFNQLY